MALYLQERGYDAAALLGGYTAALNAGFKAESTSGGPIAPVAPAYVPTTTPVPIVPAVTPLPMGSPAH